jgi:hypothetical protein
MDYGFRLALLLQWMTRQSIKQCGNGPGVRPADRGMSECFSTRDMPGLYAGQASATPDAHGPMSVPLGVVPPGTRHVGLSVARMDRTC